MTVLILGLILFLGVHSFRIVAPSWREAQYARLGEGPWKGMYSLVSFAGLVLLIWGYGLARADAPLLYEPPVWMKHVNATIMLLSMLSLGISQVPAGKLKPTLKHPMVLAVLLWSVGHLLANGDLASILLFGGFLVWSVAQILSYARRMAPVAAAEPVSSDLLAVGVGPALSGPTPYDVIGLGVGLALYLVFLLWAHSWLFGVAPL